MVRWSIALFALGAELLVLSRGAPGTTAWWLGVQFRHYRLILPMPMRLLFVGLVSTGAMAAILLTWAAAEHEVRLLVARRKGPQFGWIVLLIANAGAVAGLAWLARATSMEPGTFVVAAAVLGAIAVTSWCLAAMPGEFWLRWAHRNRNALPATAIIGILAYLLVGHAPLAAAGLQQTTAWACAYLLRAVART